VGDRESNIFAAGRMKSDIRVVSKSQEGNDPFEKEKLNMSSGILNRLFERARGTGKTIEEG
jgi:hypothetical protein